MWVRDNCAGEWVGYKRDPADPIVVLNQLPRGLPKLLEPISASAADTTAVDNTITTARRRLLLHAEEEDELKRVLASGTRERKRRWAWPVWPRTL
jgi:hypothetical protein